VAVRRIGALRTLAIGEVVALAAYGTLFWAGHFSLRGAGPSAWLLIPVMRLTSSPRTRAEQLTTLMEHPGRDRDIDGASRSLPEAG
jgi:hypothetical protein